MNVKKNTGADTLKAFYELLNPVLSVPVYRGEADPQEDNYVVLYIESSSEASNNARHVSNIVIITDVVTRHTNRVDDTVAIGIDNEISEAVYSIVAQHDLPAQSGIQITSVRRDSATYITENDGTFLYHRIATRNVCRVAQLQTSE